MAYKKNASSKKIPGIIIAVIQLLLSALLTGLVLKLNVLPVKYVTALIIVLIFLSSFTFYNQLSGKLSIFGKIFSLLICIVIGLSCYYTFNTSNTINEVTGTETKTDSISVIVLKEDPAQSLDDAKLYTFGIQKVIFRESVDEAIAKFNSDLSTEIKTTEYDEIDTLIDALYSGEINAVIINEAYRETIKETYTDFDEVTKVLKGHNVVTDVNIKSAGKEITKEPFTVYISGIDIYGSISQTSRSDVNIIATVNPVTKQVLLTTTPRDYYVPLPFAGGAMDKLTHAGLYGVDASVQTLNELYDINIDYYVRVNFTSLINIVDALGGITVTSDYSFKTSKYSFKAGENQLNGDEALAFSRERYAFSNGDNQRGLNQTLVLKAILNKICTASVLTNYNQIMKSISSSFETNMTSDEIKSLVRMQLNDMASWNIVSNAVTGSGDMRSTYSGGSQHLYVMIPNQTTISETKIKMQQVENGEIIN